MRPFHSLRCRVRVGSIQLNRSSSDLTLHHQHLSNGNTIRDHLDHKRSIDASSYSNGICYLTVAYCSSRLARYSGIFRSTNALGMMVSFIIDSRGIDYWIQQTIQLIAYAIGMLSLISSTHIYMTRSNYYSESEDNVIVPTGIPNPMDQNGGIELQSSTTGGKDHNTGTGQQDED